MSSKNLQGLLTSAVLVKSLFFIPPVYAQAIESQIKSQSDATVTFTDSEHYPALESPISVIQDVSESGSPSLYRQPTEGEKKFEPKRIPLRIPRQNYYRASPSITIINPSGYGAGWGNAGIGIGFQERARFVNDADGVMGFGFGLGNPTKNVGVQIGISLVDVDAPFRDGTLSVKLHRRLPEDFSIAVGTQGAITWGNTDGGSSLYGVVTKRLPFRRDKTKALSEMYISLGVGGGQYRSEFDIQNEVESVGVFGSFALRVVEPVSLITEWSGQDLTIGTSIVPFKNLPIVIVPAITDITGSAGDGARFVLGAGYSISF